MTLSTMFFAQHERSATPVRVALCTTVDGHGRDLMDTMNEPPALHCDFRTAG
jgi:hypothetical protein